MSYRESMRALSEITDDAPGQITLTWEGVVFALGRSVTRGRE